MRNRICLPVFLFTFIATTVGGQGQSLDVMIDRDLASLVATYKSLHAAPELSHHEEKTAAFFANQLRAMGYTVTERIGKYENPEWTGYGVVAVMKNGTGPTVLVRTELDALPVDEKTGLPYASKVKTKNEVGQEVSVMHACGHDVHITNMLGTAKMLSELKDQWHGTLIILGQPAEETIDGARAVLRDGLYEKFPKPDYTIALHDDANLAAGTVGYTPGYALASSTAVDIKIRGLGGHGSKPDATKDPIVVAAQVVMALQTIVSRENSPFDPPIVTVSETEITAPTYNDPQLTERLAGVFIKALGANNVVKVAPAMLSEDFGYLSLDQKIPSTDFWLGAVDPAKVKHSKETGTPLPSLHSALFEPLPEPTLRPGIKAMTSAVLELMKK